MSAFPPTGPTCLTQQIRAYVYKQFEDDDDIQAFNSSFNALAQNYLSWFVDINLPIYTGLSGSLLDWVAWGLYGMQRPVLPYGKVTSTGLINTWELNTILINSYKVSGVINLFTTTDDIFKRILTWWFFKGDGQVWSITWLKRRIMRFLIGVNGTAPNIDNTYPISVVCNGGAAGTITIEIASGGVDPLIVQVLQAAIASGAVCLPFQYSFSTSSINTVSNLYNDAGVLGVLAAAAYPSAGSLPAGSIYSNGGLVGVVPSSAPIAGAPVFWGAITAAQLLTQGAAGLPWVAPITGSSQLWVPGGVHGGDVWIA